jgi:hypothetical protein
MDIKRITVNVSEAEYAELVRRAKVNRRSLADEAGMAIASAVPTKAKAKTDLQPAVLS